MFCQLSGRREGNKRESLGSSLKFKRSSYLFVRDFKGGGREHTGAKKQRTSPHHHHKLLVSIGSINRPSSTSVVYCIF